MSLLSIIKAIPDLLHAISQGLHGQSDADVNRLMVLLGQAFGPRHVGLRHFSELSQAEQAELLARVPVLKTRHTDYPPGLDWIPRTATSWVGMPPIRLGGTAPNDKPIPAPGTYWLGEGYLADTSPSGLHARLGWRWDDQDQYYSLSFTIKQV